MAIISKVFSRASNIGLRFVKSNKFTKWNGMRALTWSIYSDNQPRFFSTGPARKIHGDFFLLENFVNVDELMEHSAISPYPLSTQELLDIGHNKHCYCYECYRFLKMEVAVRLAHMIIELQSLPVEVLTEGKCVLTIEKYCRSFNEVIQFENKDSNPEAKKEFNKLLLRFRDRHQDTETNMTEACDNIRKKFNISLDDVHNQIFISCNLFEFWRKL